MLGGGHRKEERSTMECMMKGDNKEGKTGRNNRKLITSAEMIKVEFPLKSRPNRTEIWFIFKFKATREVSSLCVSLNLSAAILRPMSDL